MAFEKQEKILGIMSKICDEALALRCKGRTDTVWYNQVSEQTQLALSREQLLFCRDDEQYYIGIENSWYLLIRAEAVRRDPAPKIESMPKEIDKINCAGVSFELIALIDRDQQSPLEYYRITLAA